MVLRRQTDFELRRFLARSCLRHILIRRTNWVACLPLCSMNRDQQLNPPWASRGQPACDSGGGSADQEIGDEAEHYRDNYCLARVESGELDDLVNNIE